MNRTENIKPYEVLFISVLLTWKRHENPSDLYLLRNVLRLTIKERNHTVAVSSRIREKKNKTICKVFTELFTL